MVVGNNGVLDKAKLAKLKTSHAQISELFQLECTGYQMEKEAGDTNIELPEYLLEKGIISEIEGEDNSWKINKNNLLGINEEDTDNLQNAYIFMYNEENEDYSIKYINEKNEEEVINSFDNFDFDREKIVIPGTTGDITDPPFSPTDPMSHGKF